MYKDDLNSFTYCFLEGPEYWGGAYSFGAYCAPTTATIQSRAKKALKNKNNKRISNNKETFKLDALSSNESESVD